MILEVGRDPQSDRQKLLDGVRKHGEPFTVRAKQTDRYTRIWRSDLAKVSSASGWKEDAWQHQAELELIGLVQTGFRSLELSLRTVLNPGDGTG
jgi:hypothetical protein